MPNSKLTTEELTTKIVTKVGAPLPTYDYTYRKYVSAIPENIEVGSGRVGVENADLHDTFREACLRIVSWHGGLPKD